MGRGVGGGFCFRSFLGAGQLPHSKRMGTKKGVRRQMDRAGSPQLPEMETEGLRRWGAQRVWSHQGPYRGSRVQPQHRQGPWAGGDPETQKP